MTHSAKLASTDLSFFFHASSAICNRKTAWDLRGLGRRSSQSNHDSRGIWAARFSPHLSSWKSCSCPNRTGRTNWSVFLQVHSEGELLWLKSYCLSPEVCESRCRASQRHTQNPSVQPLCWWSWEDAEEESGTMASRCQGFGREWGRGRQPPLPAALASPARLLSMRLWWESTWWLHPSS